MSDFIFYIYVLYTYLPITLVSCRPGFLCFLSVTCKYFQVVAILGAAGWVFISLFLFLALTLLERREISSCKTLLVST